MAEEEKIVEARPTNTNPNQIKDATKVRTPVALKNANASTQKKVLTKTPTNNTTKTTAETTNNTAPKSDEVGLRKGDPERAFYFLDNVDNGKLYNTYKNALAQASNDPEVKKDYPVVVKLFNFPNVQLPNRDITVIYGSAGTQVNEEYFVKTLDEVTLLALAYLTKYMEENDANHYTQLLNGMVNGFETLRDDLVSLITYQNDPTVAQELGKFVNVVDAYLNSWNQFKSEYPDPASLKKEVVVMATADATQTGGQAGSIFSNLLDAVYGILGSIVDALKNYATEIAEVLVAGMLGYSVIRYGRQMINGLVNMVSALF